MTSRILAALLALTGGLLLGALLPLGFAMAQQHEQDYRSGTLALAHTLAAAARLDKYHLARRFRSEVGLAPHAYLVRLRVSRAKALLRLGEAPTSVACKVGFYDQSQMTKHFSRVLGASPMRFARAPERFA